MAAAKALQVAWVGVGGRLGEPALPTMQKVVQILQLS